jgi:hypothetical protein
VYVVPPAVPRAAAEGQVREPDELELLAADVEVAPTAEVVAAEVEFEDPHPARRTVPVSRAPVTAARIDLRNVRFLMWHLSFAGWEHPGSEREHRGGWS